MPASIFDAGSYGSATAYRRAVAGINCMSPIAPFGDRARLWYADSTSMTARTSLTGTSCSAANLLMMSSYGTATASWTTTTDCTAAGSGSGYGTSSGPIRAMIDDSHTISP